jgi:hypothetical protein
MPEEVDERYRKRREKMRRAKKAKMFGRLVLMSEHARQRRARSRASEGEVEQREQLAQLAATAHPRYCSSQSAPCLCMHYIAPER